jgi:hypothetical protein
VVLPAYIVVALCGFLGSRTQGEPVVNADGALRIEQADSMLNTMVKEEIYC